MENSSTNFQKESNRQNSTTPDNQVNTYNYPNQTYWNANPYTPGFYGSGIYWPQYTQDSYSNQSNTNPSFASLAATLQNIEKAMQKLVETQITLQKDVALIKEKLNLDSSSSDLENKVISHDFENIPFTRPPLLSESTPITKIEHVDENIDVDIENDEELDATTSTSKRSPSTTSSPSILSKNQQEAVPSSLEPQKDSDDDVPLSKIFSTSEKPVQDLPKSQRRKNIKPALDDSALNSETKMMREKEKERRLAIKKNKTFLPNIPTVERSSTTVPDSPKIPENPKKSDIIDLSEEPRPRPKLVSSDPNVKLLLVNPGHPSTEEDFYLPEELSKVMKPYQLQGVQFLWENIVWMKGIEGCILADNMGLGKTLQVIAFVWVFLYAGMGRKVMIITPATLVFNWQAEFNKWLQKYKINLFMLHGRNTAESRLQCLGEWSKTGGVLLLGYEMYRSLVGGKENTEAFIAELCNPGADLCVIDEGHRLANPQSSITELLKRIRTTKRIVLTGYPLQNRLTEYWTMVDFARPAYLGTLPEFRNMFENPIHNGLCADSRESDVKLARKRMYVLAKLLKPFMLRRDVSYLKALLPPKQEYVISVALTPIQYALYKAYLAYRTTYLGHEGTGTSLFSGQSILLKLCNHPDILKTSIERKKQQKDKNKGTNSRNSSTETFDGASLLNENAQKNSPIDLDAEDVDIDNDGVTDFSWVGNQLDSPEYKSQVGASHKMTILFDIIRQTRQKNEKILIFSQSVQTLDCIEKFIDEHNAEMDSKQATQNENTASAAGFHRIHYYRLDGSVSYSERIRQINIFNNPKSKEYVFLLSTRAGGYGINLIGASRVVLFDVSWNPAHDIESIFRYGQTRPTFIYRLVSSGTLESIIYSRQVVKQGLFKNVVDERPTRRSMLRTTAEDLFKLQESGSYKDSTDAVLALQNAKDDIVTNLFSKYSECLSDLHFHESLLQDDAGEGLEEEERKSVDRFLETQMRHITGITNDTALARLRTPRLPFSDSNENTASNSTNNNNKTDNRTNNGAPIVVDLNENDAKETQHEPKYQQSQSTHHQLSDNKKRMYNIDSDSDDQPMDYSDKKFKMEKTDTRQDTRKYLRNSQDSLYSDHRNSATTSRSGSYTSSSSRTAGGVPISVPSLDTRFKSSKPCKYFHLGKVCTRVACKFSHDPISEDERKTLENVAKTPCKYFHVHGKCFAGNECKFSHDPLSPEGREYIESVSNTVGTFTTLY